MISVDKAHLFVAARSHPGMSGKTNEDRYKVVAYQVKRRHAPAVLAIVTDGIGGHRGGEVAAEIAVEAIQQVVSSSNASRPVEILRQALDSANQAIVQKAQAERSLHGMGTTCACTWIIGNRLYTAALGDSRIYLARGGQIQQVTTDHTWTQEAVDQGLLTVEQARSHPNAHVIRRYLGSPNSVKPDTRLRLRAAETNGQAEANQGVRLLPGDQILLCSDGLTDLVTQEEILAIIKNNHSEQALDQLISLANQRGGHDNITIVLLEAPAVETRVFRNLSTWRKPVWVGLAAVLVVAAMVAILAGFSYWERIRNTSTVLPTQTQKVTVGHTPLVSTTILPAMGALPTESTRTPRLSPTATLTQGLSASLTPWPTNTASP